MDEIWRTSVSVDSYEISTHGRVRHGTSGEIRKLQKKGGQDHVNLSHSVGGKKIYVGITVSRETLKTFVRPENGKEYAKHRDTDKDRIGYNHLSNLEWSKTPPVSIRPDIPVISAVPVDLLPCETAEIKTIFFGANSIDVSSDALIRVNGSITWRGGSIRSGRNYPSLTFQFDKDGVIFYKKDGRQKSFLYDVIYIVSLAFLGARDESGGIIHVDHIDGSNGATTNNHSSNLRYVTQSENQSHAMITGNQIAPGQKPVDQYTLDGEYVATYCSQSAASLDLFGNKSGSATIGEVCNGIRDHYKKYTWRHSGDPFERVSRKRKAPTNHVVYFGKLKTAGEFNKTDEGKFNVKIGVMNTKRPPTDGGLRGMVSHNIQCDEYEELKKFLLSHQTIVTLKSNVKAAKQMFHMTEDDFQMAIRLADDNVESYMNFNEDEDV